MMSWTRCSVPRSRSPRELGSRLAALGLLVALGLLTAAPSLAQEPPPLLAAPAPPDQPGTQSPAAASDASSPSLSLVPIPQPDLAGLEKRVADELVEAREIVKSLMEQEEVDGAILGRAFGDLGLLYHAHDLNEAAAACYQNAVTLLPGAHLWVYSVGYLAQQSGDLETARRIFQSSLKLAPDHLPTLYHLAELAMLENRMDDAKQHLRDLLDTAPDSPAGRALAGEIAFSEGRYEEAVEHLEAALAAVPAANRLHYPLGMSYRQLGNLPKAQEHLAARGTVGIKVPDPLEDALAERAVGERVHLLVGQTAFRAGRYAEAVEAFRRAVEAEPESARARVNLASALGLIGEAEEAIRELDEALRLQPDNITARFNLGSLQMGSGQLEEAEKNFRAVLASNPVDVETLLALARILESSERAGEALPLYERAAQEAPFNENARLGEARLLVAAGRLALAKERLEDANSLAPELGRTAHALARLLAAAPDLSLRNGTKAAALAENVYRAAPTAYHAETLALALAEAGRCEDAVKVQERAIQLAGEGSLASVPPRMLGDFQRYQTQRPCRLPGEQAQGSEGGGAAEDQG